jgi:ribonucleoside-diphosphate reductase subunit M1
MMGTATTGIPTPSSTPPPIKNKTFEADKPEGASPPLLTGEPTNPPDEELQLDRTTKTQEEDKESVSKDREGDIYSEAVLQCSIENKEECMMCSG